MGKPNQCRYRDNVKVSQAAGLPENCESDARQAERKIKIEEAHLQRPPVGEHDKQRQQEPCWAFGGGGGQSKRAPEEYQHGGADSNLLAGGKSKNQSQPEQE